MANEIFDPEEAWQFCNDCDPNHTRPFSAERAYNKHRTSQGHLKVIGQPLRHISCPECGKLFSRESAIQRHLASGQCLGRRSTLNAIPESSRKHALSVSPNGIVWKIQKSAASDLEAGGTSPHPSVAPSVDHSYRPLHKLISPDLWSGSRTFNDQVRSHNIASPLSQPSKISTGSTVSHNTNAEIMATSLLSLLHAAPVAAPSHNKTLKSGVHHPQQDDRTNHVRHANNDSRVTKKKQPTSSPHYNNTPITSMSPPNGGEETDQWLSTAMESASLKDDNLAYSQVQAFLSSTPATTMSSWSSLFLKRSPCISVLGWSLSPLPKASPLAWPSVRSIEMPAPMLTGPVDEELRLSRSTKDQSFSAPIPIWESHNRKEAPTKDVATSLFRRRDSMAYQSAKISGPEIPGPFNTSVDSEFREARRPIPYSSPDSELTRRGIYFESKLLDLAKAGDLYEVRSIIRHAYGVDVNYKSPFNGRTALMIAVEHSNYQVVHELMRYRYSLVHQCTRLSMRDKDGNTVIDLVAAHGKSNMFTRFMERVVAILCCCCPEQARRGSICEWIAHTKMTNRHGVTLQGPVKYPFRAGCHWGEKLRQSDWLQAKTLKEIDEWMAERDFFVYRHLETRMDNEWRDTRWILEEDQ